VNGLRPFFLHQVKKLNQLERLLYALISLLAFALLLTLTRGALAWLKRMETQPVHLPLFIALIATLITAMLIHRRASSWLNWLYKLTEDAPGALVIADALNRIVYANRTMCLLTGYSLGELTKMNLSELFDGELTTAGEAVLRTKASASVPVLIAISEANVSGLKLRVITAQDISQEVEHRKAQERLNRRLEAMYRVASALSEYTELGTILERGLEAAMETLNAPAGRIYMFEDGDTLKLVKHKGISSKFADEVKELRYGVGNVGTVAKTLKPSIVDYLTSTSEHRNACLNEGLRCSAFAALKAGATVYGVLAVSYREPLRWGEEELSLLEAIGNELGVAIQRARLVESLKVSNEWYRNLFMLASDSVCILKPDGEVIDANEAFGKALEKAHGSGTQPHGKSIYELIAPYSVYMMRQWMDNMLKGIETEACEIALGEREQVWYEVSGSLITDERGNAYVICLMRDVTRRVRHKAITGILEKLRRALERMHRPHEVMLTATELLSRELNCGCAILLHSHEDKCFYKLVAALPTESSDGKPTPHRLVISEPEIGVGIEQRLWEVISSRRAKIASRGEDEFSELLKLIGMPSDMQALKAFILPMTSPERSHGVLLIVGEELDDEDIVLFQSAANEVAASLETAMLCERLLEMNEKLEELVKKRTARLLALYELSQAAQRLDNIKAVMAKATTTAHSVVPCIAAGVLVNLENDSFAIACALKDIESSTVNELIKELVIAYERSASAKLDISKLQLEVLEGDRQPEWVESGDVSVRVWELHLEDRTVGAFGVAHHAKQPLSSEDGEFITSLVEHITLALQGEISSRLKEKAQLSASLEALGIGMLIVSGDGEVLISNSIAKELLSNLGKDEREALAALGIDELIKAIASEGLQTLSREVMWGDRWFEVKVSQWRRDMQQVDYAISLRDITPQKLTEQQLSHARKLASIGELASGVAHEINNPLTAIVGFAELQLEREDLPEETRRDLMRIYNAGLRAREITHKLLAFSRGLREKVSPELIDPKAVVDQALDLVVSQFRSIGIELERDYEPDLPTMMLSQALLQQIVLNLVLNAKDAIEASGKGSKVTVRLKRHNDHIVLIVEDNGPGIPQDIIEKIFDPFFTTKPSGKGTGLGLSIVHRYVEEMGGRITVWSVEGVGTKFTVTLPIALPEDGKRVELEEKKAVPGAVQGSPSVLVVDDESSVCAFVEEALKQREFDVVSVTDPREVLSILEQRFFDVILLDIRMPHINGLRLYELIRERMPEQAQRVVFLTGDILSEIALEAQGKGVPMLLKPLTAVELSSFLGEHMAKFATPKIRA